MKDKRILTIQDVSCLGQCSLTVALPILSACGHETCILPTALLSTHTGGDFHPTITHLADTMAGIREDWQSQGFKFDAVYTGYLGSIAAIEETEKFVDTLLAPGGKFIADPAMGDNGSLYPGLSAEYAEAMDNLCRKADVILPNVTEAAIMTGETYREAPSKDDIERIMNKLDHPCTVLTGVGYQPEETGAVVLDHGVMSEYHHRKYPQMRHGTGDIFASALVGAYLRGRDLLAAATIAADMVCESILATGEDPEHWYGVKFEKAIPELIRRLESR